ncbi:MAG: bifunctional diaminohydroxyphosphoribosylaminopyrimidine deaminase/5-amino-6-(5-phosphoribosylamino)uracil reductase RibD [Akkermansia sp.]|nr:bifunctional diaminohydroxyphosphoribosylaminopyrimidine deaminase/5-amino-6-(5-phosphoribosylamino)uracil reductase RibD [Akkermansia sp.]
MLPSDSKEHSDSRYMQLALEQARHGIGTTSPNPPVGAVIIKDGYVIGQGYHERAGELHAERRALADACARGNQSLLRGATIYVTLEPCSTYGKTPPCTEAILEAGLSRVVYGAVDPDERHRGRADALLKAAGVDVCAGVEKAACELLLRPWAYAVTHKRPWVLAKVATTLDGRLTRRADRWLSTPETLKRAHEYRLRSDAILTGGHTVRTDNPSLTIRTPLSPVPSCKVQPWRIVMTRDRNKLPLDAKLLTDEYAERTLVAENISDLSAYLHELYVERGVVQLMLECGGRLLRRFSEEGLINEWAQEICPYLSGGPDMVLPGDFLPAECSFRLEHSETADGHVLLRGIIA